MDPAQLRKLSELARTSRDAAATRLARLEQHVQQAREHLQTLVGYSQDYAARLRTQAGDTLDTAAQANKRADLAKPRMAMESQQPEVGSREQASAAGRAELAVCQRKLKSLQTLIQRRADEASRHAARREQRHTDEAAQRTASSQSASPVGSHATADLHRI
jgi:flagellar FliJ protein